jgi:hypothetical protein
MSGGRALLTRVASPSSVSVARLGDEFASRWHAKVDRRLVERIVSELSGCTWPELLELLDDYALEPGGATPPQSGDLRRSWARRQLDPPSFDEAIARIREVLLEELRQREDWRKSYGAARGRLAQEHPVLGALAAGEDWPPNAFDGRQREDWEARYNRAVALAERALLRHQAARPAAA